MWSRTDLKLRLALQIAALSLLCCLATAVYVLVEADRSAHEKAERIAELVARDLQSQQERMHWITGGLGKFPDLQNIAPPLMSSGLCIAYRANTGAIVQRLCNGTREDETAAPPFFANLYRRIFDPERNAVRNVSFRGEKQGEAIVSLAPARLISQAWSETSRLIATMAVSLLSLCLLVYAALAHALRPTRTICQGLQRLAANDLSARLPPFDLAELTAIGQVFNQLAEGLDQTLAERNELTRRLIAVQDEERQHLARELHDEFGQCLAAIGAVAFAIEQTAKQTCPELLPECRSIAQTVAHMMDTLRGTLVRLRPPDVDEIGLAASLESLVNGWNARSCGDTRFRLYLRGSFERLPSALGAALYRIAQEAITNAAKHARATRVDLVLHRREEDIELIVEDNGKALDAKGAAKPGMGLLGIRERTKALGGRLSFESGQPTGLVLRVVVPVSPALPDERQAECPA